MLNFRTLRSRRRSAHRTARRPEAVLVARHVETLEDRVMLTDPFGVLDQVFSLLGSQGLLNSQTSAAVEQTLSQAQSQVQQVTSLLGWSSHSDSQESESESTSESASTSEQQTSATSTETDDSSNGLLDAVFSQITEFLDSHEEEVEQVQSVVDDVLGVIGQELASHPVEVLAAEAALGLTKTLLETVVAPIVVAELQQYGIDLESLGGPIGPFLEDIADVDFDQIDFEQFPAIAYTNDHGGVDVNHDYLSDVAAFYNYEAALQSTTDVSFSETPLDEVINNLATEHDIVIEIDEAALAEAEISPESLVTVDLSDVTLREGLDAILEPLGLTYVIKDGVLTVTTPEAKEAYLDSRLFPPFGENLLALQSLLS